MRLIRLLNLRLLFRRRFRTLLAAVAVAAGVALPVSMLVVRASVERSLDDFSTMLAGPAQLRVLGPNATGGITPEARSTIASTPNVTAAAPVVLAGAALKVDGEPDRAVAVIGVDCLSQGFLLGSCPPGGAISPTVAAHGGELRTVAGRFGLTDGTVVAALDEFNSGAVVVLPLETAQAEFVRGDRVDEVYVVTSEPEAVRAMLTEALPTHRVLTATEPPPWALAAVDAFVQLIGVVAVFALGIGTTLAYNSLVLTLEERRRQFAVVAALGGSGRVLVGGVLVETAVVGLLGGVIGLGLGAVIGRPIAAAVGGGTQGFTGVAVETVMPAIAVVAALVIGLFVAVAASILPLRRARRIDVTAELSQREIRHEATPRRRAGLVAVVGVLAVGPLVPLGAIARSGVLEPWQVPVSYLLYGFSSAAFALLSGLLAPLVVAALAHRVTRRPRLRLALANLARAPARTGVMAGAVAGSVGLAFVTASYVAGVRSGIRDGVTANIGDWVEVATDSDVSDDVPVGPEIAGDLGSLPEVAGVNHARVAFVPAERPLFVQARDGDRLQDHFYRGEADVDRFESGQAVVSTSFARRTGLGPGDAIRLPGLDGAVDVPILGVIESFGLGADTVRVPMSLWVELFGAGNPSYVYLVPADGTTVGDVVGAATAAGLDPDLTARTPETVATAAGDDFAAVTAPFWAVQQGLVLVSGIAVLSTLLLSILQRRREYATVAAVGMSPREVAGEVVLEAGLVGAIGGGLGVGTGLGLYLGLNQMAVLIVGFDNPFRPDPATAAFWAVVATAFVAVCACLPAWRVSRLDIPEALRFE